LQIVPEKKYTKFNYSFMTSVKKNALKHKKLEKTRENDKVEFPTIRYPIYS